jgi:hypothetical protein
MAVTQRPEFNSFQFLCTQAAFARTHNGWSEAGGLVLVKGKLAKLLLALTLIVLPVKTPKELEDILHIMNGTRVEVSIPEENGKSDTK